ncbi:MAG TPA: hypothetical protein VFL53_03515 [Pseudolabrys sp.]|nr:hypothetical protein [Pseudolabrys sp.]
MLEFNFQSIDEQQRTEFAKLARGLPGNRASVEFLVNRIGVRVTKTRNDSYFAEARDYLCAHLFAHANMPNEAAQAIAASNVLPHSGGDALFSEAVAEGVAFAHAQDDAIKRGVPAVILASMPRAASAALTQTLAQITGAPIFRVSIGKFPNCWLMPAWLKRIARGGAILHDHFGASEFNVGALRDQGIDRVFVLVRDPRAAAVSAAKMEFGDRPGEADVDAAYSKYISWLHDWIDAEKSAKIKIRWIRSRDVTHGSAGLNAILTAILGSGFTDQISRASLAIANASGQRPDEWREAISPQLLSKMWTLLPPEVVDRLELRR